MRAIAIACVVAGVTGCAPSVPAPPRPPPAPPADAGRGSPPERDAGPDREPVIDAGSISRVCGEPMGAVCLEGSCGDTLHCVRPSTVRLALEDGETIEGTRFPVPICSRRCEIGFRDTCGCGVCVPYSRFGRARIDLGDAIDGICRPSCELGCPAGYACDATTNACLEACARDEECGIVGEDTDGDSRHDRFRREDGWRCEDGLCHPIDGPERCAGDADCGAGRACVRADFGDSLCVPSASECGDCPAETVCIDWRGTDPLVRFACMPTCAPAAEPEPDRLGRGGHGAGCPVGFACALGADRLSWACRPGEYNEITAPDVGAACLDDSQCFSPYGHGACVAIVPLGAICTVACTALLAAGADPALVCDPAAGLACLSGWCQPTCASDADCRAPLACSTYPGSAARRCGPPCRTDAECDGSGRCIEPGGEPCPPDRVCQCLRAAGTGPTGM